MLAGFVGGEVDKLAETKGENWVHKEEVQHKAKKDADQLYDDHYGGQDQFDPNQDRSPAYNYGN